MRAVQPGPGSPRRLTDGRAGVPRAVRQETGSADRRTAWPAIADAGAFLARLTRLDPARWSGCARRRRAHRPVGAAALGRAGHPRGRRRRAGRRHGRRPLSCSPCWPAGRRLPARRDAQWRWPLPPARRPPSSRSPAAELSRLAAAAAGTLREVAAGGLGGRAVGSAGGPRRAARSRRPGRHTGRGRAGRGVPATRPGGRPGWAFSVRQGADGPAIARVRGGALGGSFCTIWSRVATAVQDIDR